MKITITAALYALITSTAVASDHLVPSQYATIQAAIDAAADGDTIIVSQGNTWPGFSVSGKSVIVRSASGFARTKVVGGVNVDPGTGRVVELNDMAFMSGVAGVSGDLRLVRSRHINSGVSISETVRLTASGSEFANGSLSIAGTGATIAVLDSCHFTLCTQAIVTTRQLLTLTNCSFDSGGKAINSPNGKVVAQNCGFSSLTTTGTSGVCYVASGQFAECSFNSCAVAGGADTSAGGAIYAINDLVCSGSTFSSCSVTAALLINCGGGGCSAVAEASGGAIRCGSNSRMAACSFNGCWVRGYAGEDQCAQGYFQPRAFGGALRIVGSDAVLQDCSFLNCRATAATKVSGACGQDEVNGQAFGGAIHSSSAQFNKCSFSGCMLLNETNGASYLSGSTRMGSAIYAPVGGTLAFTACRFDRNGPADGSAIAAPNFTFNSCIVTSNGVSNWLSGVPCLILPGGSPYSEAFFYDTYFAANAGTPSAILTVGSSSFAYLSGCYFCGLPGTECSGYWFQKGPNYFGFDCSSDCDSDGVSDAYEIAMNLAADCNHNDVIDSCDIALGSSRDVNKDGIPDTCQCIADISGDGIVSGEDLGLVLANWGLTHGQQVSGDINADGIVNGIDLGYLLNAWGPCPN